MAQGKINEDNETCNGKNYINMVIFDKDKQLICEAAGLGTTYFNEIVTEQESEKIKTSENEILNELAARLGKKLEDLTQQEIAELKEKITFENPIIQKVLNFINQESMRRALEETNEYEISSVKDNSSKENIKTEEDVRH